MAKEKGVKRFGLHTMVASNELNTDYFIETVELLLSTAAELNEELNINFEFINFGGGIGIPYSRMRKPLISMSYLEV
jgi:diaminopimelate decarboxylase